MSTLSRDQSYEEKLLSTFDDRRIFIIPGGTWGNFGIDSLAAIAMMASPEEVYAGSVFAFCHKTSRQIRFLLWDDGGYWLISRKIYSKSFAWPERADDCATIKASQNLISDILRSPGVSRKSIEDLCRRETENKR